MSYPFMALKKWKRPLAPPYPECLSWKITKLNVLGMLCLQMFSPPFDNAQGKQVASTPWKVLCSVLWELQTQKPGGENSEQGTQGNEKFQQSSTADNTEALRCVRYCWFPLKKQNGKGSSQAVIEQVMVI